MNQQQPQAFGNVLPANSTQSTNMIEAEENEHRTLARMALQIITGVKEPEPANLASLFKQIEFLDIEDVKAIMRLGCDTYADKYNKYPTPFFWKGVKREVLRKKTAMAPDKIIPKEKQTETERENVSRMAREAMERFAPPSKKGAEQNLYAKKFARYKKYIDDDMVRVEDPKSDLFQKWVPRKQATMAGVYYHDPIEWVKKREDELGKC